MNNSYNTAAKKAKEDISEQAIDETIREVRIKQITNRYKEEKVSGDSAEEIYKVDEKSDAAQGFLSDKTDLINKYAEQTIEKVNQIGIWTAEVLTSSSDYVKNFDVEQARQQIKVAVRDKPELSIAAAGILGLLIGLLIGRKNR